MRRLLKSLAFRFGTKYCIAAAEAYNLLIMSHRSRKFRYDIMPHHDTEGHRGVRIVNFGMQDPRIVRGTPVLVEDIIHTSEPEQAELPVLGLERLDPVRAIHLVAQTLRPNLAQ
ncbi:MAG TPA: hypothetical protein VN031_01335 [Candidatus Microsaccharimonas sp.]|nr:hypothetical protein [Candidatus Microsaccharimonas sp.]